MNNPRMLDGESVSSTIEPATLDQMIVLGEALVHYGDELRSGPLRASSMEADLTGSVAGTLAPIPADCMELSIVWLDDSEPLDVVPETDLRSRLKWSGGGSARQVAQAGDNLVFLPAASDGQAVNGRYYAKPPALKDELHPTFNRYPELYLYAALYSATPFLGFDRRIPVWQAYYRSLLSQANKQEQHRVYSGSRLRTRTR